MIIPSRYWTPRVRRVVIGCGYAAFYLFALVLFAYFTFPYERLRDRLVQEFNQRQTGPDAMRLEVDELDSYWLSGVEGTGIRLISAAKPAGTGDPQATTKPSVMVIDSAHARLGILGLLFGSTRLTFGADAFGGSISGFSAESDTSRELELELEDVALSEAPLLADAIGLPFGGTVNGAIELVLPENKLAKAEGNLKLTVNDLSAGDGKAKIRDTIALPKVEAGNLVIEGEVTAGQLKLTKFEADGPHLELVAEGGARLRDPASMSLLSLSARFRFTDRYKNQNDVTRGIFGAPGSTIPALFDLDPKNKRAKRPDGFYGWRVSGTLAAPTFVPNPSAGAAAAGKARSGAEAD
jgi:type II secretion system protein N